MRAATIAPLEIRLSQTARSRCMQRLNQSAFAEIADVSAAGALDHVDGELEQANLPGFVHALDDGAERFVPVLNMRLRACANGFARARGSPACSRSRIGNHLPSFGGGAI